MRGSSKRDCHLQLERGLAAAGAATVAGTVEGDARGLIELSGPFFDTQPVVDEVHDFPGPTGEGVDPLFGFFLELEQVAVEIHGRAGAGRDDDREISGEDASGVAGDLARGGPIARVEGWLAATGLVVRKLDGHPEVLENLDGGLRDLVVKGVAEAGAHEEDAFAGGSLE